MITHFWCILNLNRCNFEGSGPLILHIVSHRSTLVRSSVEPIGNGFSRQKCWLMRKTSEDNVALIRITENEFDSRANGDLRHSENIFNNCCSRCRFIIGAKHNLEFIASRTTTYWQQLILKVGKKIGVVSKATRVIFSDGANKMN